MATLPIPLELPSAPRVDPAVAGISTRLTIPQKERRRALIVPREHGAWGMLLVPLVTGAAVGLLAGGQRCPGSAVDDGSAVTVLAENAGRKLARHEHCARPDSTGASVGLACGSAACHDGRGHSEPTLLARKEPRTDLAWNDRRRCVCGADVSEENGTNDEDGGGSGGRPGADLDRAAAYYVATGRLDARAWALWLVNWLFAADQIHFVWLRIRGARAAGLSEKFTLGWSFLAGTFSSEGCWRLPVISAGYRN